MKREYIIPLTWNWCGRVGVEAENIDEAMPIIIEKSEALYEEISKALPNEKWGGGKNEF